MSRIDPLPPLALYVHLPWCTRKCPYCDFNSHAAQEFPENDYVDALMADLDHEATRTAGRTVESVFIGGGTPSLFSAAAIDALLRGVRARVTLAADCEITLEANPGSAEARRFAGYRDAGVNRLSIGVQSFDDDALARIGRVHDGRSARRAIEAARAAGFERLNVDLMYGLPGQSPDAALDDVRQALDRGIDHLSHYELTIEPNTLFHRFPPPRPGEEACWQMHVRSAACVEGADLRRYEISAYARAGAECRHNLNYWRFGDYLGIGAGAHGKLTEADGGAITRNVKHRHPRRYLAARGAGAHELVRHAVVHAQRALEFMLNAARLLEGFPLALFEARTGLAPETLDAALQRAEALGLVRVRAGTVRPTERGIRFLNEYLLLFEEGRCGVPAGRPKRAPVDTAGGAPVL